MSVAFDHRDPGTSEDAWRRRAPWRDAPPLSLDIDRLLVVAAHPDDETLGAGGLIATAHAHGIPVSVLVLTDGEAATPDSPATALTRRRECLTALDALGGASVRFAGLPDARLRDHEARVRAAIALSLAEDPDARTLLAVPWWGDGHGDHRVAGEAALRLAGARVPVVGYPIWMWHWESPDRADAANWRTLALAPPAQGAKETALRAYESQLAGAGPDEPPILHAGMQAHFRRAVEVFIAPPTAAPARRHTPEWFDAFYARHDDPWGFESRWYERRKRDLLLATLPEPRSRHILELGCATGSLTALLAGRADRVTAVDVARDALTRARERVSAETVTFLRMDTPEEWPDIEADLVVLSELAYYWTPEELGVALTRIRRTLTADGRLVACHWRPPIDGCALTGDEVHRAIGGSGLFRRVLQHVEEEFVLEVFAPTPTGATATSSGAADA